MTKEYTIKFSSQKKCNCPGKYCIDNNVRNSYRRFAIFDKNSNSEVQLLDNSFGVCDKKDKCGYQKTAKGLFYPILDTYKRTGNVYSDYPNSDDYKAERKKEYLASNTNSKERRVYISSRNRKIINSISSKSEATIQSKSERLYIPHQSYNRFQFKSGDLPPFFFEGLPVQKELLESVLLKYCIGILKANDVSKSNLLFPYIDMDNRLHGVEIKEFDSNRNTKKKPDGSKVNKQFHVHKSTSDSIKSVLGEVEGTKFLNDYQKQKPQKATCFGQHLINDDTTNVIGHESCKNALIFELFNNDSRVVNVATGSKWNLTINRFQWIQNPDYQHIDITLIPDSEAVSDWSEIVERNFRSRSLISFDVISPVDLMEPYFLKLDDGNFDYDKYLSNYFVEDILKIDIADLILDYWKLQSEYQKKEATRVQPVNQVQRLEDKSSIPTEVERKSIKHGISSKPKPKPKEYITEINGIRYLFEVNGNFGSREPMEWNRYNMFTIRNQITGKREEIKRYWINPDSEVLKELGEGWTIEAKVEINNTIDKQSKESKKEATRVQPVKQVEISEDKSSIPTESPTSFIKRDLYSKSIKRKKAKKKPVEATSKQLGIV